MQITKVGIKNFKGIKQVVIDLDSSPRSNIFPLVGLNESGKSTLLEALSHTGPEYLDFSKEDPSVGSISAADYRRFIPVPEKHNFNGKIQILTNFQLSSKDKSLIADFVLKNFDYVITELEDSFELDRYFIYKDSKFIRQETTWSLDPTVKTPKGRKKFKIEGDNWLKLLKFVRTLMPKVLFFKNELFDIPDKIYIGTTVESSESGGVINAFYRDVVQDILFAIDTKLTVSEHILARKKSKNQSDREALDLLLELMSAHMTKTVMHQWEKIFGRKLRSKSIRVVSGIDEADRFYLQIRLVDGAELFNINQRSTGFRWFFVFILLTQYRGYRNESAIFLYDEPASNLHSSAQQQLLDCFAQLPKQFNIIYSTHSHYLIRPEWLDTTFVVQNEAAESDENMENIFAAKTNIKIAKYRQFVSKNPNGLNYFQPILDVLRYIPSRFDFIKSAVFMEGKSDFYLMTYMADINLKFNRNFDIMPCGGSGSVDQLICLYSGWGKDFIVLLDADQEGRKAKDRYIEKFGGLVTDRIVVYSDIDDAWTNTGLEKITGQQDATIFCQATFPNQPFNKKNFSLAIQELLVLRRQINLTGDAKGNFQKILGYLSASFEPQIGYNGAATSTK